MNAKRREHAERRARRASDADAAAAAGAERRAAIRFADDQIRFIDLGGFLGAGIEISARSMRDRDDFRIAGGAVDVNIEHAQEDSNQYCGFAVGRFMAVESTFAAAHRSFASALPRPSVNCCSYAFNGVALVRKGRPAAAAAGTRYDEDSTARAGGAPWFLKVIWWPF